MLVRSYRIHKILRNQFHGKEVQQQQQRKITMKMKKVMRKKMRKMKNVMKKMKMMKGLMKKIR